MRVNIYAEEMTRRVEIVEKEIDGIKFTGLRFYLYMPVGDPIGGYRQGPFIHHENDDDSSAVTFWGKNALRDCMRDALAKLEEHYENRNLTGEKIGEP